MQSDYYSDNLIGLHYVLLIVTSLAFLRKCLKVLHALLVVLYNKTQLRLCCHSKFLDFTRGIAFKNCLQYS